ncbi:hypothetical protein N5W20_06410 [Candidatus Kirkpatrickella diaphorinae]|uniref:Uncharacterized protein n=1 Tax=Candidatus Kirkpatrickella diaphorinae TaxID=2984322 RepID=A0ABY6GGW4_9PROT|nr:hypothetical protein [Candidatus Kirkpatrickella diaphorinae]UYH50748.1 hypothetical protein N5W20_06410 [Candidatus Kirkpatrickella diaphorinae]
MKTASRILKTSLASAMAMGMILAYPQHGRAQSDAAAASSSSDHGQDLLDRMDAAETRLHDKAASWKKSNHDWKSKGADWQKAQKQRLKESGDRLKSKWSSDKEKLVGDADNLKKKSAALSDARKKRLEAGRQRVKDWQESRQRHDRKLSNFVSKTKKDFKDLSH